MEDRNMIRVYMYDAIIAEYSTETHYADPAGGNLYIRAYEGDVLVDTFEEGEWTDVRW
jgi:hypothetical protein